MKDFTPKKEAADPKWKTPTQSNIPSKIRETRLSEDQIDSSPVMESRPLPKFDILEKSKPHIPKPQIEELTPNTKTSREIASLQKKIEETRRTLEAEKIDQNQSEESMDESIAESDADEFTLSEVPANIMSSTVRPDDEHEVSESTLVDENATIDPTLVRTGHSLSYVNKQFDFLPDSTTTIIKEELTSPRAVTDIRRDLKESGSVRGAFETGYTPDKNKKKR